MGQSRAPGAVAMGGAQESCTAPPPRSPLPAARCSGVLPLPFCTSASAQAPTRTSTTVTWPPEAALCSAEEPFLLWASMSQPAGCGAEARERGRLPCQPTASWACIEQAQRYTSLSSACPAIRRAEHANAAKAPGYRLPRAYADARACTASLCLTMLHQLADHRRMAVERGSMQGSASTRCLQVWVSAELQQSSDRVYRQVGMPRSSGVHR